MAGKERYLYPGNNTVEGFYSYYDYIISQREANKIFCMKGGPGTGKSTFMKKIGKEMQEEGWDVDYFMCSSDPGSLDGIVIREKKIAIVDGTSPHVVDPKNPGAVDEIINLGEFWDEEELRKKKDQIIRSNEKIGECFGKAYQYFAAAGKLYEGMKEIYDKGIKREELYKNAASIVYKELAHRELSSRMGKEKKFFASAMTPAGFLNTLDSLTQGYRTVYLLESPVGLQGDILIGSFRDNALRRGYDVESYYCPMKPGEKIEHLLVPRLSIAFITSNRYHRLRPAGSSVIDMRQYVDPEYLESVKDILLDQESRMNELLEKGVECIRGAKAEHDLLEQQYIPNMDFSRIEEKRISVLQQIRNR